MSFMYSVMDRIMKNAQAARNKREVSKYPFSGSFFNKYPVPIAKNTCMKLIEDIKIPTPRPIMS